jgi:hypothetical protein
MGRGRRTLGILGAFTLAQVALAAGCVRGVTPDCSDPAVQCGPSLDGASADGSPDRKETAAEAAQDTFVPDALPDAPDADLDAGDEA